MVRLGLPAPLMTSGGTFSETYIKITGDAAEGTLASFWGLPLASYPEGRGLAFEKAYAEANFNNPYEAFGPMGLVEGLAHRVIAIDHGAKIAEGSYAEVCSNPEVIKAYLGSGAHA